MTLAQVVYQMSNDRDFAAQLFSTPESTLAKRGLRLSKEELAFLLTTRHTENDKTRIVSLADTSAGTWRA